MADDLIAMFASITTSDHEALVAQFSKVLQIEPHVAQFFLESSSWNVETAINTFLASVGSKANLLNVTTHPAAVITCQPEFASGGQKLPPGARRTVMIHLKNSGTVAWPSDTRLGFCDGTQLTRVKTVRVPCLDPGQEQFFNLEIGTPREPGSYASSYRLGFGGGFISEPIWIMLTVDAALAEPAAAAPAAAPAMPVVTHPHDPLMSLGGSSVASGATDMAMGGSSPPPSAASTSLFAPTSFAAPTTAPAPAATEAAAPPAFTWTGFRSAPAASGGGSGSGGGMPAGSGFGGGFGTGGFGFAPAATPAAPASMAGTAPSAHSGASSGAGGGGDGDDMMMDL